MYSQKPGMHTAKYAARVEAAADASVINSNVTKSLFNADAANVAYQQHISYFQTIFFSPPSPAARGNQCSASKRNEQLAMFKG